MSETDLLATGTERELLGELFRRVGIAEQTNAEVKSDLKSQGAKIDTLVSGFEKFREQATKGTDWNLFWAAAGVLFTIIVGLGTLVTLPMHDRLSKLEKYQEQTIADGRTIAMLEERSEWLKLAAK